MLDIGWTELLVIAVVLIVVVGPKDLPPMLRAFGKMTSNLRKMAGDFRTQFDEALREADMDDVRKTLSDAKGLNPANALRDAINPLRQMGQDIRDDLQRATAVPTHQDSGTRADDPLLTGDEPGDVPSLEPQPMPQAAPQSVSMPAQTSSTAMPNANRGVAMAADTLSAVPDTLTAAPDVPVRKPRASRTKAAAPAPGDGAVAPAPDGSATASSSPAGTVVTRPRAKKPVAPETVLASTEPAAAGLKTPRARKKATAPKDDA